MSDFPKTRHEMERAGYRLTSALAICKGCGAAIEWWKTKAGKSIPMNPAKSDDAPTEAHWATCPNAKDFKGAAATPAARPLGRFETAERDVRNMRELNDARVVVMIDQFGTWKEGIPGEDLRHDLISAGNFVRNQIAKKEETPA
jgi:hypothetical protein